VSGEEILWSYLLPPAAQELSLCWKCFLKYTDFLRVADVSAMSKRAINRKQTKGRRFNMQQVKYQRNPWQLHTGTPILLKITALLLALLQIAAYVHFLNKHGKCS